MVKFLKLDFVKQKILQEDRALKSDTGNVVKAEILLPLEWQ